MSALTSGQEKVRRAALTVFLPALGMWARELGRLEHQLMHAMLRLLEDTVKAIPLLLLPVVTSPQSGILSQTSGRHGRITHSSPVDALQYS